jgi:hypothetical protein
MTNPYFGDLSPATKVESFESPIILFSKQIAEQAHSNFSSLNTDNSDRESLS